MLDERTLDLINADIDGELSTAEQQQLDSILESSSEARAMRAELLKLSNLLDNVPDQSPPPGLKGQIIDRAFPTPKVAGFSLSNFFASFQPLTAGAAFAAGLLLTVGFYELSPEQAAGADSASMVGTMVAGQTGQMNLLENNLQFSTDGFSGTVSLSQSNGLYVLNFDLDSVKRQAIQVGLDHTGLVFGGFAETPGQADTVVDSVLISGGTMRVVSQGKQNFTVFLRETGPGAAVAAELITIDFSTDEDHA